ISDDGGDAVHRGGRAWHQRRRGGRADAPGDVQRPPPGRPPPPGRGGSGPPCMATPLAAAVAGAAVGLLLDRGWRDEVRGIEAALKAGLAPARALAGVIDVRVL